MKSDEIFAAQAAIPNEIFERDEVCAMGAGAESLHADVSTSALHIYFRDTGLANKSEQTEIVSAVKRCIGNDIPIVTFDCGHKIRPLESSDELTPREIIRAHPATDAVPFPVRAGNSVGAARRNPFSGSYVYYETGTVGLLVKPQGSIQTCYLSNSTILGPSLSKMSFEHVSPSHVDGGVVASNRVGILKNWMFIGNNGGHDSALGTVDNNGSFDPTLPDGAVNGYADPRTNDLVFKYGRSTGRTEAIVRTINVDAKVYRPGINKEYTFVGQAICWDPSGRGGTVRLPGDDGAVWLNQRRNAVLQDNGQLDAAGSYGVATGVHLIAIIHRFDVATMYGGAVGLQEDDRSGAPPFPSNEQIAKWRELTSSEV